MSITRRTALKQLGIITGGMVLLPGCMQNAKPASVALKNIPINGDQEMLLTDIVDAIIPAGELPGAKALNVHQFVLKMVDDCQSPENQKIFTAGLADIDAIAKKKFNESFSNLKRPQKEALLTEMEKETSAKKDGTDKTKAPPATFLSITKRYTIQGYMQSEYVMTNVTHYNMIPGRFDGCIPMDMNKKIING